MEVENSAASEGASNQGEDVNIPADASTAAATPMMELIMPSEPPRAPILQHSGDPNKKLYWDRSHYNSPAAQMKALAKSSSLYIGNLAFTTRSQHVRAHFSQLGPVKNVIMGLDRMKKTPCGFCFVEYVFRHDAVRAVAVLSGTKLDGKVIRVELDAGFQPGRQYGRGVSGGQVRDDRRNAAQKRSRNDFSANNNNEARDTTRPVSMDGALPSSRGGESSYGPSGNDKMDEDGAPPAKRRRM